MLGAEGFNALLAIGISGIPTFARLMPGEIRRIRNNAFVLSATALGVSCRADILRHLLPNVAGPVVVASRFVGRAITYGASLNFLGLGLGPARAADWRGWRRWRAADANGLIWSLALSGAGARLPSSSRFVESGLAPFEILFSPHDIDGVERAHCPVMQAGASGLSWSRARIAASPRRSMSRMAALHRWGWLAARSPVSRTSTGSPATPNSNPPASAMSRCSPSWACG